MKQHQLNNFLRMFMLPCVIFLFTLLPNVAQAANANDVDIKLKWGDDANYTWEADKARLKITFKFWDGQSRDDHIHNKNKNVKF